jgi:hypothetical protein
LAQQAALEPPYRYNRVVIENDLSVTPPRQVRVRVKIMGDDQNKN